MAFECQQDTNICLKDTSTNCLDNLRIEKVDSDQLVLIKDKNFESLEPENPDSVSESNVQTGIRFSERLPDYKRSFADLPPALISEIFNSLDPRELGIVSCVSTYLYGLASEHHVWKEFYYERWGHPVTSVDSGPGYSNEKSWKELFVEREFRSKTFMGRYSIDTLYGHTEAVRTIFVLVSKKLVFTSGYDQVVRMWDMEEGLSVASSRPLGCTIRAVSADSRLLIAGGTDGFIHGWKAEDKNPLLFDLRAPQNQNMEFRIWEHDGPITCLALDFSKMYSGSWDMTVRVWDRSSLKCLKVLVHNDWVWSLVPHDTTIGSTAGSGVYIWEANTGTQLAIINSAHVGNAYSLARSHTGKLLFTGGEDGSIHMFEIAANFKKCNMRKRVVEDKRHSSTQNTSKNVEPPQRMLHGFGCNLFSVGIGYDRIVCGGEEGVVRIWNFSQALEIEERVRTLRGIRLENRMRRRKLQPETSGKSEQSEQCSVAAKKKQINSDKNGWHNKRRVSWKVKA
ncbi:hypothetical protein BUALT_Bualt13G0048500 [Buddleja alternifolia]|uniref:F-box domain-containing protein n=1 Tax=Buddleja alternifolia TaxID=168488 RepID=A0AAV6WKI6_9LAMI|nr:hypothetical protein BUALT_Bualt13G0048500 [Buddleja alternifolia]